MSGAMFEVLADVEVVLRNAIHRQMTRWSLANGFSENWFLNEHGLLDARAEQDIARARQRLLIAGQVDSVEGLVGELNFGFWRFLLSNRYRSSLWAVSIRYAFPRSPERLAESLHRRVGRLHRLRNLIAHHQPIHSRRFDLDMRDSFMTLRSVSPQLARWVQRRSRVEALLELRPEKSVGPGRMPKQ
jgi:hypothetical protein